MQWTQYCRGHKCRGHKCRGYKCRRHKCRWAQMSVGTSVGRHKCR